MTCAWNPWALWSSSEVLQEPCRDVSESLIGLRETWKLWIIDIKPVETLKEKHRCSWATRWMFRCIINANRSLKEYFFLFTYGAHMEVGGCHELVCGFVQCVVMSFIKPALFPGISQHAFEFQGFREVWKEASPGSPGYPELNPLAVLYVLRSDLDLRF